ncbi:MAG: DMT family transporter [Gammaproteobacteria bacterium]|jgi:drug/metabolite transporter (DMT)-like permease
MKALNNETKGIIYIILSGFLYGFLGFFGVKAMESSSGDIANMLFWRFLIASSFILLVMLPKLKEMKVDLSAMLAILIGSAIFYGSSTLAFFASSTHIGTGLAMVIFFTYPAIVVLCNRFFYKHQVSNVYYISVVLILLGLILLADIGDHFNYLGILLGLISAAGYAFYIMTSKKYNQLHPLLSTLLVSIGCAIFCLMIALYGKTFTVPQDPAFWLNGLGLGIIATAVPILLLLKGLQYISSAKASILGVLEPVFVVIFGVLLLGEEIKVLQALGVAIILGGALLALVARQTAAE